MCSSRRDWFRRSLLDLECKNRQRWLSVGVRVVVCGLKFQTCIFLLKNYVQGNVQETKDFTKRILLLPHGMGECDPTDLVGRLYRVIR